MSESAQVEDLRERGRQCLRTGKFQDAVAAFEQARQADDLDADVHEGLATAQFMLGNLEAAAQHFEAATRLDPRRSAAWINLGAVYNRDGKHGKAVEVLRRAVQLDKKSSVGFYNLGLAYRHLQQWTMAIPAYREAIRLDPKMADAYLNLGNVYLEMANNQQAVAQYKKALEIQPNLERARRGLEKAEAKLNEAKRALNPFGRLVDPQLAAQAQAAGEIHCRQLSDPEREQDRHSVHDLAAQIETDLGEILGILKDPLDPTIRILNKLLTHQTSPHGITITKEDALDGFLAARSKYIPSLKQFRRAMQQLRDHEASLT